MKVRFLFPLLVVLCVLFFLKQVGSYFSLFDYSGLAFDKILHFLGGIALGILGVMLVYCIQSTTDRLTPQMHNTGIWFFAVIVAILGGVVWEILQIEFRYLRDVSDYNMQDGYGDVIWDMIGGTIAGWYYQKPPKK